MRISKTKSICLLFALLLMSLWSIGNDTRLVEGHSNITIKERFVQGTPKGTTIQASIDGHYLTVTFTQNIGNVTMELDQSSGAIIFCNLVATPDCCQYYLPLTGDYILTFTLANGDEYYGEFSVTD